MFKTLRGSLVGDIAHEQTSVKMKEKLKTFLEENPDVDHYITDTDYHISRFNYWFGIFIGGFFSIIICLVVFGIAMYIWHALGYIHIPTTGWS